MIGLPKDPAQKQFFTKMRAFGAAFQIFRIDRRRGWERYISRMDARRRVRVEADGEHQLRIEGAAN